VAVQVRNPAAVRRLPVSLDSASRLIEASMAPLGPAYQKELAALLDSKSGRLDTGPGQHRVSGGASFGAGVVQSGVFLSSFEGLPGDVSRLAHEAGHAVENQFHFVDRVSPAYTNGTSNSVGADFLSEAYAKFNELMLADLQVRSVKTDAEKQFYLSQFLSSAMPFFGAQDAELEQAIYDGVAAGQVGNADQLDSLTRQVDLAYDVPNDERAEVKARWITRGRLMMEDPVYYFNYLYSGILTLKLFEKFSADPVHFAPRYVGLVRAGYRAAPADAVKQALDIDLTDPKLLDDVIVLVRARVDELEALFAKQEGRSPGRP
jgi:oligoendopeptidase F